MMKRKLLTRRSLLIAAPAVLIGARESMAQVGQIATWPPKAVVVGGGSSLLTDIVSYWKLDENTGTAIGDAVGPNSFTNGSPVQVSWTTGKINSGLNFLGGAIGIPPTATLRPSAFSISLWTNAGTGSLGYLINQDDTTISNKGYELYLYTDATANLIVGGGSSFTQAYVAYTTGWQHIVATFDGTTAQVYRNTVAGTQIATIAGVSYNTANAVTWGASNAGSGGFLNGDMDEVGFWSRVLSPTEISTLYNSGAGLQYPF